MCLLTCALSHLCIKVYIHNNWCLYTSTNTGDELCDVALFILKSNSTAEAPASFITFTEHQVHKVTAHTDICSKLKSINFIIHHQRFVCKLDLDAGNYTLVPFTTGCRLKPRDDDAGSRDPVSLLTADSSKLTPNCV